MLKHILPLIPPHDCYIEAFLGGGAVFFAKKAAKVNIINDKDGEVVNFYQVIFDEERRKKLVARLEYTPHAESVFNKAKAIYADPSGHDAITRAWAFFVGFHFAHGKCIENGYSIDIYDNKPKIVRNKIDARLKVNFSEKIQNTQICERDGITLIKCARSTKDFIYIDPPYINSAQGHYGGYTHGRFRSIIEGL